MKQIRVIWRRFWDQADQGNYGGGNGGAGVDEDSDEEAGDEEEQLGGERWNVGDVLRQPAHFVLRVEKELQAGGREI